jgi:iron complex outermembrane receptor protein
MSIEVNLSGRTLTSRLRNAAVVCLCLASTVLMFSQTPTQDAPTFAASSVEEGGQTAATASLSGVVNDAKGAALPKANVIIRSESNGSIKTATTDATGHFSVDGLKPGSYTVEASAPGFAAASQIVKVSGSQPGSVTLGLAVGSTTSDITVEADATGSVAAALAPMDALLSATSARTEITTAFIRNFTSPIADYGEIVNYVPGTFTTSSDGVGLGQSSTYFRGFADGNYDIDYDGVPFYDTNTPTHHSWAFFPSQSIGSVDFDRSPGGASTIGPTPFGGSIHLLSPVLSPINSIRATFSGGSYNTFLYDLQYDSGQILPNHKLNFTTDIHHLQSHGYQSLNNQNQNAGDIKVDYKLSDTFDITGYSGVIWLDANTPNFSATRCQMYGVPKDGSYSCALANTATGLYPYTGYGINFLLTNNSDPLLYLDTQYNFYHVPTDFEYVGVHKELGKSMVFEAKGYTYNYDNSEKYSNAVPITDNTALIGTVYKPLGVTISLSTLCNQISTKKGVSALPCGVDKYNSYRKYGETSQFTQTSKFGILRAGLWYERGLTNRHQYPADPLTNWTRQLLPNFAEKFETDSYQPFVEYQYHAFKNLDITGGVKFAYYTIGTQQFADDGKTIGCFQSTPTTSPCNPNLNPNINPNQFISNGGTYFATLPSGSINYRIKPNWSVYFQGATGSVVPPSKVFDFQQGTSGTAIPPLVLPKQQKNTTYQGGTVIKTRYITFDADYYHIYFDNSYSSFTSSTSGGEPTFFAQPASITQGLEAEFNISLTHGLGIYFNDSYTKAVYTGQVALSCIAGATGCTSTTPQYIDVVPPYQYVQNAPDAIQTEGVTYQHRAWDAAFFNKRVGLQYLDNGSYHNQAVITAFDSANAFVNYTIRRGGRFDQTKVSLSFNNLFNSSAVTGLTQANASVGQTISANGTTYTDTINSTGGPVSSGQDNVSILAGRSIMLSVTFGYNPKGRK